MAAEWLTYAEAGARLGISPEAARQKAIRGHWPKRMGNDGRAVVQVDVVDVLAAAPPRSDPVEQASTGRRTPEQPPVEHQDNPRTLDALDAHIATLREMVSQAEAGLSFERSRVEAEQQRADGERNRADTERERADKLTAELAEVAKQLGMTIDAGRTHEAALRTELDEARSALADWRARPWWRRLAG